MVHWIGSVLVGGVDDLQEFVRVQGSAADQAAVHVLLGQQGLGVGLVHGAAVLDGSGAGDAGPIELAQDAALRSISLTVRVTPPRGICQALLTDVAYELSVKSAAKRLQIFALRL